MVEKLELILSAQSGANDDLCGIFLALASAHWLSKDRGSLFQTVFLDEIQSHMDKANRSALARKLPSILTAMDATQCFLVAHTRESIEALPERILVESDGRRSTVRVVT